MRELKERVAEELRGRALTRKRATHAWIDPVNGWLVVDAAGASRAEELIETLRDTLGTLAVEFLETQRSLPMTMAAWLMAGDAPQRFTIEQDLELQSADQSKPTIRYARHPLDGNDIRAHISAGMYVTRLGLTWSDRVSFVLTDKFQIKRLEFLAIEKDQPEGENQLAAEEQFDLDFTLMAGELSRMLAELAQVLGVEESAQSAAA
jgi:recombination associated protein RdgC